jgi:hypothetical protein
MIISNLPLGIKLTTPGIGLILFSSNVSILFWLGISMIIFGVISYNWKAIRRVTRLILFNIEFCCLLMAHAKSVAEYVGMINVLFAFSIWTECKDKDYYPMDESICADNHH